MEKHTVRDALPSVHSREEATDGNYMPPLIEAVPLGLQHVLAMFVGNVTPGMSADFIAYDLAQIEFAGALHDPLAALLFCAPTKVAYSFINGKLIVEKGHFTSLDMVPLARRHNELAEQLLRN